MDGSTTVFSPLIDLPIMLTYIMISIGTLSIIYFAVKNMIQLNNESKKTLFSIGGIVFITIVAYLFAPADILPSYEKYNISITASKLISTGLNSYSILGIITVALILFYLFRDNWKKTILLLISLIALIYIVFNYIDFAINITYLLVSFALIIIAIFTLKGLFAKTNTKSLYTLLALVLIFSISYLLASSKVLDAYEKYEITSSVSKQVGMGIYAFYILFISTFIAMIYSEFSNKTSK